ncbi:MAG: endoribonuclease YicC domain-containing protein, partial [bacterium]
EFDKLKKRLESITNLGLLQNGRLEMEVALIAERVDVTEECIRFKSHNSYFLELLENGESAGRKLNFLLQEMNREANTIGAKANDSEISQWVVEAKDEVEKLREQIQNIE